MKKKQLALFILAFAIATMYHVYTSERVTQSDDQTVSVGGQRVVLKSVEYTDRVCTLAKASGDISVALAISCYPRVQVAR